MAPLGFEDTGSSTFVDVLNTSHLRPLSLGTGPAPTAASLGLEDEADRKT